MKGKIYNIEFDPMKPVPSRIAFFINLNNGNSTMIEDKMYLDDILESMKYFTIVLLILMT
ncbi:hypothetical protein [Arachidicoccus soli]|uniref:Uncharacterized protein n=1 Tax=Arachidicoccus soli TaxID=2341117 RepID=A0A386HSE3_9BACT|nr:hypothetical protein [Arachidicoccus soli]AYD48184.1 hypothetical protein D6B99_11610 [Arachidicoccus soli]